MLKGFKEFISRGNAMDLAVGVIIGGAFGAIVNSLVADLITPAIGMIFGKPDFSAITVGSIQLGKFMNAVVSFVLVAAALYFFIVVPMNKFVKKEGPPAPPPPPPPPQEVLLREIRDLLAKR
jgi:large conductance mechanosensitive channel